jgi:hypothetical protein
MSKGNIQDDGKQELIDVATFLARTDRYAGCKETRYCIPANATGTDRNRSLY